MAVVISIGIQKGGVGKSTTAGILSWLFAKDGYKTLAIDFDSQGNLTNLLTQKDIYKDFPSLALDAVISGDIKKSIYNVNENLDIVPSNDLLSTFSRHLFTRLKTDPMAKVPPTHILRELLSQIRDDYDVIFIDQPPNLGEQTMNALVAADETIVMLQTEWFCWQAIDVYMEYLTKIQQVNPNLTLTGILRTLMDKRSKSEKDIIALCVETYGDMTFDTVIGRLAKIKDFSHAGISESRQEDREAISQYRALMEEVIVRAGITRSAR
jgi:chromosome partitioning protein